MNGSRRWIAVLLAGVLALGGCNNWNPLGSAPAPAPAAPTDVTYLGKSGVRSDAGDSASAVDAALALSDKQTKLTEELLRATQANRELEENNRKLAAQAAKAQEAAAKAFDAQIAPLRQTLESQLATERRLLDALAQYHRSAGNLQLQAVADIAREIKPEPKPATAVDWPRAMNLLINMGESYLAPKGP